MDVIEPIGGSDAGSTRSSPRRTRGTASRFVRRAAVDIGLALPAGIDGILLHDVFVAHGIPGLVADAAIAAPLAGALPILVELVVDRVAADGALAAAEPELFPQPRHERALDPRHGFSAEIAEAALADEDAADAVGRLWGRILAGLSAEGIAGARLLGLPTVPAALLLPLLRAMREMAPDSVLIADTGGLAWDEIRCLDGVGLDGVLSSLAWWDGREPWFQEELRVLRSAGPVLAALPDGHAEPGRALGLAVAEGIGWIVSDAAMAGIDMAALAAIADHVGTTGAPRRLNAPGQAVAAILRCSHDDPRASHDATLLLLNTRGDRAMPFDPAGVLPFTGGAFSPFAPLDLGAPPSREQAKHEKLVPGHAVPVPPGGLLAFRANRLGGGTPLPLDPDSAVRAAARPRLALESPSPCVDGGQFAVKRLAGEVVTVEIDVIGDGHDVLSAALQWQGPGDTHWHETRMRLLGNDRWQATFPLETRGLHLYRVQAWRDRWANYRHELGAKHAAGVPIALELTEGASLVRDAVARGHAELADTLATIEAADADGQRTLMLSEPMLALMQAADDRPHCVTSAEIPVDAERTGAGFASWYEVFPRSMADDPGRHGTFRDVERHLPRIRAMGFDVLYFPPIHPIGRVNRKGPNNTLTPGPRDVGSPYAVGNESGGHEDIHAELGSLEDFLHLRAEAERHGLELALDFAIQCAPDHPWLSQHKDWFEWRSDGSIRYAENPPKKYQDIVNVDFYASGSVPGLWLALAESVLFWCRHGIRLFRVDNPHTKPFPFWEWMIAEVRARYPDAVFLAEAFTRPKVMARLAKVGFGQSYTYFTWRNSKAELTEYLTQLTTEAPADFFRPHFFVNTPDINPAFLQTGQRGAFLIRAAAAATLSGLFGVYNGFELCEGTPLAPGKEEYLDSEKFQIRTWDWDRPGNIVAEITQLNRVRAENPALRTHMGIEFLPAANDAVLFFRKSTPDLGNTVLVAISLDPANVQRARIELPLWRWGLPDQGTLALEDLVGGGSFTLSGKHHDITLSPDQPYLIWRAEPAG